MHKFIHVLVHTHGYWVCVCVCTMRTRHGVCCVSMYVGASVLSCSQSVGDPIAVSQSHTVPCTQTYLAPSLPPSLHALTSTLTVQVLT